MVAGGGFWRGAFGRAKPEAAARARVKAWALAALGGSPDLAVTVSEIVCVDPGCPGVETAVLVMRPGERTRACTIAKPVDEVTEQDLRDALV